MGWIEAIGLALFGSLTHLALVCYEARQVPGRWEIFGHLALGPVSGFLFKLAAFPNHLNVFFAGFFAIDFIRMLARVYKPREEAAAAGIESPEPGSGPGEAARIKVFHDPVRRPSWRRERAGD